ncbi:hypothetical protein LZ31DRAFT_367034 [Colletotrichum somersetense]|nr:hypothetical protein LZ31DRAFT_367034 [Colletotrichum somersetense]
MAGEFGPWIGISIGMPVYGAGVTMRPSLPARVLMESRFIQRGLAPLATVDIARPASTGWYLIPNHPSSSSCRRRLLAAQMSRNFSTGAERGALAKRVRRAANRQSTRLRMQDSRRHHIDPPGCANASTERERQEESHPGERRKRKRNSLSSLDWRVCFVDRPGGLDDAVMSASPLEMSCSRHPGRLGFLFFCTMLDAVL